MKYRFLRYPGGKFKAVTLSYDDGNISDVKFIETINKYGLKATFNLCSTIVDGTGEKALHKDDVQRLILDGGHEVALHGHKHMALGISHPTEVVKEMLYCRLGLEKTLGRIIRGMAYPDTMKNLVGEKYLAVKETLKNLDIVYARSCAQDNDAFDLPQDWHMWVPTAHHDNKKLFEYWEKFASIDEEKTYIASCYPRLFYIWGHSFEFDRKNNWERLEEIGAKIGGHEDIWYATNIEIYDYVRAYDSLIFNADGNKVYNPTLVEVWFSVDRKLYSLKPGETLNIT